MESTDQPDERHDDLPKDDDASIEVVSDSGDSPIREQEWSIYSAGRSSIAGSDVSSMDFQKLSIHSKMATIVHHDGRQFIERRHLDDGGLPYSAEFYLGDEVWKLNGEDCLLMSPRRYIAKVSVEGTVDLEAAVDFEEAVRMLLKHLKVVKVLLDEQLDECQKAKRVLERILDRLADESGKNIELKRDVMLLRILLQKHGSSLNMNFRYDLRKCSRLSSETLSALDNYVTTSLKLIQRNEILGHVNDCSLSDEFINDVIQEALNRHRTRLADICPAALLDKLKELPDERIMCVFTDDMNLFNDLMILDQAMFGKALPVMFSSFLTKVREISNDQLVDFEPLSSQIVLYLCKSLQMVGRQLGALTGKTDNAINYSEAFGWEVTNFQDESSSPYNKCLRHQFQMLATLVDHFKPGGSFRTSRFPYEFKLFQNMDAIPEPVRIWLCLLDDCMKDLVQADIDKMQMLSCFFKSYVSFVAAEDFQSETLECLRTITHDALQSLADMTSVPKQDRTTSDAVLQEYNDMISSCLDKFLCEHFANDCGQIQATLRRIIGQAINRNAASEEWTEFSYVFKQLLKDISDLPLEWYLQLPLSENRKLLLRGQFVVSIDNCWKDTEYECLKVVDSEGFVKMYKLLHNGEEIPKHYQLKAIQMLLDKLAAKQSCYEGKLRSNRHQLDAMTSMINCIRNSLSYFKRQPEYSCFESFLQKLGESISQEIEVRRFVDDGSNRTSPMKDSEAADPSYTDQIDFGESLESLLGIFEGSISKGCLTNGLKMYATQFNKHIRETVQLPRDQRLERIGLEVVRKAKPQLATSWTEEFKRNELPEVLAGLSAVWSLIVSRPEKLIKPSGLQISCVLSFFGDQNDNEDDLYKLLYISTQQGKELVVGLTAALLALHGHKVLIACFNSSLARRNSIHLIEFFKTFAIEQKISYGSVEDMVRDQPRIVYQEYAEYVYGCLGIEMNGNNPEHAYEDKRSVLLIEDIQMLLLNRTLGQTLMRYIRPTVPGLALVQEKFFDRTGKLILHEIDQLIMQSDDPELSKLREFLDKPHSYKLHDDPQTHTNRTLFKNHVKTFDANLYTYDRSTDFRLSRDGVMMLQTVNGYKHDRKHDIGYFALKNKGFQRSVNGYKNYGFLTLGFIPFLYADMLRCYPLVFGFADAPLDGYEELSIHDHYNIYHKICKSNPFRAIPVKFDSKKDFLCVDLPNSPIWDWLYAVMVAINSAIDRNYSVLVFFKSGREMEEFQNKFALQLKRLNVTSIETASNGKSVAEDELAVDEITVLAIERNGDLAEDRQVHVIQTFFSDDFREENLLRRQAERGHGSGSYELIVYKSHLSIPSENEGEKITYDLLAKLRTTKTFGNALDCWTENMKKYKEVGTFYCSEGSSEIALPTAEDRLQAQRVHPTTRRLFVLFQQESEAKRNKSRFHQH